MFSLGRTTRAIAVVIVSLAKSHGVEYVFAAVVLAGFIQVLAGPLRLGKFIRLVPHPVMFGFVNGLAVVIFLSQLAVERSVTTVAPVFAGFDSLFPYTMRTPNPMKLRKFHPVNLRFHIFQ